MRNLSCFFRLLFVVTILAVSVPSWSQDYPKREMRAIWIATVNNIDWPSKPGMSTEEQQAEMIKLLDNVSLYHMNTVVFQIRPCADAFYPSKLEPWSQWLTGKQGQAPEPYYDPLAYAIQECRKRGIDVHVWLNPYRAVKDTSDVTSPDHITNIHPEWFLVYGRTTYFDPGLQQTRDFVASVVGDIVRRYDVDAVHMDDYFYPYRIANLEFPDDSTFAKNPRGFASERKDDWRRDNVDLIIRQIHDTIKAIKPWVEFGISPFGVWRNIANDPGGSKTKAGQTNYDDLYADILKWQKEGWIDYVTPQIYWQIGKEVADYSILSDWWSHNAYGCQVYIGQAPYRIDRKAKEKEWRKSGEIIKQIRLNRTYPNVGGSMYFSGKFLEKDPLRIKEKMLRDLYKYQALTPSNALVIPMVPDKPKEAVMTNSDGKTILSWKGGTGIKNYVVYKFRKGKPANINNPANILMVTSSESVSFIPDKKCNTEDYFYVVTSQSHTNMESVPVYFTGAVN